MLQLVILELPKLPETADSGVWPWLRFFTCKRKEEYEMLAHQYPELEKPIFCVKKMSLLEKWRDWQFHKNLWKEDARMRELYVREEGLAEGHAKGHAKGHAEGHAEAFEERNKTIAKNALAEGATPEFVNKITGLDIETIKKMKADR